MDGNPVTPQELGNFLVAILGLALEWQADSYKYV
jgi:hypothetical protein